VHTFNHPRAENVQDHNCASGQHVGRPLATRTAINKRLKPHCNKQTTVQAGRSPLFTCGKCARQQSHVRRMCRDNKSTYERPQHLCKRADPRYCASEQIHAIVQASRSTLLCKRADPCTGVRLSAPFVRRAELPEELGSPDSSDSKT